MTGPTPKPTLTHPMPTVTVTKTITVTPPQPTDVPLTEQLQGWGAVGAVVVALAIALIGWWVDTCRRRADAADDARKRSADRADADRRLHEEREAADRRLKQQLDHQNDRDRREYLVQQLEKVAELYRSYIEQSRNYTTPQMRERIKHHPGQLALRGIPPEYASLVRLQVLGIRTDLSDRLIGEAMQKPDLGEGLRDERVEDATFAELIENVNDLLGQVEPENG